MVWAGVLLGPKLLCISVAATVNTAAPAGVDTAAYTAEGCSSAGGVSQRIGDGKCILGKQPDRQTSFACIYVKKITMKLLS